MTLFFIGKKIIAVSIFKIQPVVSIIAPKDFINKNYAGTEKLIYDFVTELGLIKYVT